MQGVYPDKTQLAEIASNLAGEARDERHRRGLILAGEARWCREAAQAALQGGGLGQVLWIGARAPAGVRSLKGARAHRVLGQELDGVVFDAHSGFDPEAFGAAVGTVRGGGLLLVLTPPLQDWPRFPDPEHARIAVHPHGPEAVSGRFLARLARVFRAAEGMTLIEQGRPLPGPPRRPSAGEVREAVTPDDGECRTEDQRRAVQAIERVAKGHRRRPLVLTSDRGRGKSAALGIAAARLLRAGLGRIVVTAPSLEAAEPVFRHAARLLSGAHASRGALHLDGRRMVFAPPDTLCATDEGADLVLVDEAAAIPTPLLERLLRRHARIVFATTVHGYEGSGRGFALRFQQVLERRTPQWRAQRLETPIRWAPHDPVEGTAFRALLLDALPAPEGAVAGADPGSCLVQHLDRDALAEDEATLSALFGLLVLAHYRTRPGDLRQLLDGPNVSVFAMRHAGHVVACALVAREGDFDAPTAAAIWAGRRRPRGHLIPQSLATHGGLEQAARLSCARIMRIAVHPALQGHGLGTRLVQAIAGRSRAEGVDYLGASFGGTVELLRFWARSGLVPVRVGVTRGAASGTHSVMVLRALSARGEALCAEARERFLDHLPLGLSDPLRDLDPGLAARLLHREVPPRPVRLDARDWRDLVAFGFGLRGYEVSLVPIWRLVCAVLADPGASRLLDEQALALVIGKVLQRRPWQEVSRELDLPGRAQVVEALRQALRPLILQLGDPSVQAQVERLRNL